MILVTPFDDEGMTRIFTTILGWWCTVSTHPTPYTLHPTPYTLHPTPLHPTPYTPTPYTLRPTPYTLHPTPYTNNPYRCRANLEQISQSRPDSGLGLNHFQYRSLQDHSSRSLSPRQRISSLSLHPEFG